MKKFLKITLLLLLIAVMGYFGYTHLKKTSVLLNVIHKDAESVIKIGIHDISKTVVLDALTSPGYYWKNSSSFSKEKKNDTIEDDDIGIDIKPYSLVFYTTKDIKNTFFSTLTIYSIKDFEKFITAYASKKSSTINSDAKGYKYLTIEKSKLAIAWDTKKAVVAVLPNIELNNVKTVFEDVLLDNKLITDKNNPIIKSLSNSKDHIFYKNNKSTITLNFEDEKAIIDGKIYTKNKNTYNLDTAIYQTFSDASLQLFFDANFNNAENKKSLIKTLEGISFFPKNNIDVHEFLEKTNGYFSLEISGQTTQADTIISYEYDDNFEKVAKKTMQKRQVPKLFMNFGRQNKSLYKYFEAQSAIKNQVLTAIPFYKFYAKEDSITTTFATAKDIPETKKMSNPGFFNLDIEFDGLRNDLGIQEAAKIFSLFNKFKLRANQIENSNTISVNGTLTGKNETINFISQVLFGLKKYDTLR